jgi:hypothetical protein
MEGIEEGSYVVFATTGTGASLNRGIDVGSRNIDDLKLTLRNDITIRASVTVNEGGIEPPKGTLFFARPAGYSEFVTEPSDKLVQEGLPYGKYWTALITPPGFAVMGASYGGRPILHTAADFEARDSTVDFVITSRPATLTGTLRDSSQKPVPDAIVQLLPGDPLIHMTAETDAQGAFHFANLAPGKYRACVKDSADCEPVELDFGQIASVELHVK